MLSKGIKLYTGKSVIKNQNIEKGIIDEDLLALTAEIKHGTIKNKEITTAGENKERSPKAGSKERLGTVP